MDSVFFSKDINKLLATKFRGGFGDDSVVVYHAMYDKPETPTGNVLEWEKYKVVYSTLEPSTIVLIGLNRMVTPSNRCDFIHAYLTVMTPHIHKIAIDTAPFIGEPWRLYFHYQAANCFDKFGANYSYPIEGEWRRWFERDVEECQFTPGILQDHIVNTYTDLPRLCTTYELYPSSNKDMDWYSEAKRYEFEKFRTPKLLLTGLLKASNTHFNLDISFDSYLTNDPIKVPDLGIYRFAVEENQRRQDIYNLFSI